MQKRDTQIWADVSALVLLIAAVPTEALMVRIFFQALAVASWPTVEGIVLRSEVKDQFVGIHTQYEADILYRYTVNGQAFESASVRTRGTATRYKGDAEKAVNRFPTGSVVRVYYDPKNPAESYLEAGADPINCLLIVLPLFFGVGCAGHLISRLRESLGRANGAPGDPWNVS